MKKKSLFLITTILLIINGTSLIGQSYVPVVFIVSDFATNKTISGAQVSIRQAGWATKSTGTDGKVSFDNVPVGAINFIITKDGYQLYEGEENVSSEVKSNTFRMPLTIIPTTKDKILVTGEVTDKDGRDIENAWVEVKAANVIQDGLTDKSGNYSIEISLNSGYTASILAIEAKKGDCKVKQSVDVPRGNVVYKDIKLDCGNIGSTEGKPDENDGTKKNNSVDSLDKAILVQNIDNYKFELIRCKKQGNTLTCEFAVTSLYKNRRLRMFLGGNYSTHTTLYDDKGNQYFSAWGSLGNATVPGYVDRYLIADIRTLGSVTFNNIATNATRIAALYLSLEASESDDLSTNWIEFKDIKF